MSPSQPMLYPAPRQVDGYDPTVRYDGGIEECLDPSLPAQGYRLSITGDMATLAHGGLAGLHYGRQTTADLRDDGTLPAVQINDWPDIEIRGYLLDVSRDRVPRRSFLALLVERLKRARFNHLELYTEHTYAYEDHQEVWAGASPITAADLEWLDERCASADIELSVNQNTFGHMEGWLRHPRYRTMAECPDGFRHADGRWMAPTVLAPSDETARFAVGLCREQLAHVRSRRIHIGCDETFELGHGVSADLCRRDGRTGVFADHVSRIARPLAEGGSDVLYWGDMARGDSRVLQRLAADGLTAVAWTYESPMAPLRNITEERMEGLRQIGIDLDSHRGFAINVAPYQAVGVPFWVAPGTSTWNSLTGRLENAQENILDAVDVAIRSGCPAMLLTDWGDGGHHQPPAVSLPPIAFAGAVSWCKATNERLDLATTINRWFTDDASDITGQVMVEIGGVSRLLGDTVGNGSVLHAALMPWQGTLVADSVDLDAVAAAIESLDAVGERLASATAASPDGELLVNELTTAAGLALLGARNLLEDCGGTAVDRMAFRLTLHELIASYERNWIQRSRRGGLDASLAHIRRALDR